MKKVRYILLCAILGLMTSCNISRRVLYVQGLQENQPMKLQPHEPFRLRPEDKLSFQISSRDSEMSKLFHFTNKSYTVDSLGNIEVPVLGVLHVGGLSRQETEAYIKQQVLNQQLLREPVVNVEFTNLCIYVIGDNAKRYTPKEDHLTLMEALSDINLELQTLRQIQVLREDSGYMRSYIVDVTSADSIFNSPVYNLRQGDFVYTKPTEKKVVQSTTYNVSQLRTYGFWISAASLVVTICTWVGILHRK